jgi:hypothetical protein
MGGIGLDRRKLCDPRMAGRKVTHRIGGAGILLSQLQELLVGQAAQQRTDVRENFLPRRRVALREIVDQFAEGRLAGAALEDFGRNRIRLEDPFGREQNPSALRLVVNEAYAVRQSWPRVGGDEGAWVAQEVLQSFGTKAPGGMCFGAT